MSLAHRDENVTEEKLEAISKKVEHLIQKAERQVHSKISSQSAVWHAAIRTRRPITMVDSDQSDLCTSIFQELEKQVIEDQKRQVAWERKQKEQLGLIATAAVEL